MREVEFRGFAVKEMVNSQWLYGFGIDPVVYSDEYAKEIGRKRDWYLYTESSPVHVHEKSIGQYSNVKDDDGNKIYEGDIVLREIVCFGSSSNEDFIGEVKMYEGRWWIDNGTDSIPLWTEADVLRIVGNVYENGEMLQ